MAAPQPAPQLPGDSRSNSGGGGGGGSYTPHLAVTKLRSSEEIAPVPLSPFSFLRQLSGIKVFDSSPPASPTDVPTAGTLRRWASREER
mmetsp:Transcript_825/g.2409  ORF Transcript_825/g.2409 Transcript_825/m.2409 type:complete len:89 (-) Transcript_825:135-401(-)